MADVRPFQAMRYNPARVSIGDVVAPPYDAVSRGARLELMRRSPNNVVEIDLPVSGEDDPYERAAQTMQVWESEGILIREDEPAIWAYELDHTGPGREPMTRRGFLARIKITEYGHGLIRPHERTQPAMKEDRLHLTEATGYNTSPILVLHSGSVWDLIAPGIEGESPWAEVRDETGSIHRVWPIDDPHIHDAISAAFTDSELLIADGHHRYETARTYANRIGGQGPHMYTLACLVSLDDPGLTTFATHRLLHGLDRSARDELMLSLRDQFEVTELHSQEPLVPSPEDGEIAFGYYDGHNKQRLRLTLTDTSRLDALLEGFSEPYRRLDSAALETLVLKGALAMSDRQIELLEGISYVSDSGEAVRRVQAGEADAAFLMRTTPVSQVSAIARAGETMPPETTYFFPKLLTGLVFNRLR